MNGLLLKNGQDRLGLALINEPRAIQRVTYLFGEKTFQIFFTNAESELLVTEVDATFDAALFKAKELFVAHFPTADLLKDPNKEYKVPLDM